MDKDLAIKVYKYILIKLNGWNKEEVDELEFCDFESDPIYEGLSQLQ